MEIPISIRLSLSQYRLRLYRSINLWYSIDRLYIIVNNRLFIECVSTLHSEICAFLEADQGGL